MHFHDVCGSAIVLSSSQTVATRYKHFCNGITFTQKPLPVGGKLSLELTQVCEFSGAVRIGVTTRDPASYSREDLPRYAFPELTNKEGHWARALNECYADTGNRITIYLTNDGQMQYFVNNEHKGVFLHGLPTDQNLWVLLDIYGNTKSVKLVPTDEAPVEIVARGPSAMQAYHQACKSGTKPVFRTRLMLVGQDGVGKTSLKKALTGQSHDVTEKSTEGIDLSASCSFSRQEKQNLQKSIQQQDTALTPGGTDWLEEEYYNALSDNIVQELVHQKRNDKPSVDVKNQQLLNMTAATAAAAAAAKMPDIETVSDVHRRGSIISLSPYTDLLNEMPERVVQIVEYKLKEHKRKPSKESLRKDQDDVLFNIWDFAGQSIYYTTHQVFLSHRAVYVIVFNLCHELFELAKVSNKSSYDERELTNLEYIKFWMNSIHAHAAKNTHDSIDNISLSPPIFVVGTHKNSLPGNEEEKQKLIEEKFRVIREGIENQTYTHHVIPQFYAIENCSETEDNQIVELRNNIQTVGSKESYMGEQIPLKWLQFEKSISQLVDNGMYFSSVDQLKEVAHEHDIFSDEEFSTMLEFYHDFGLIIHYNSADEILSRIVILKPQWLTDQFRKVLAYDADENTENGVLNNKDMNKIWGDVIVEKAALIGLMDKFDLLCFSLPNNNMTLCEYHIPSRVRKNRSIPQLPPSVHDVCFYMDFHGFLPDGLFHRIVTRVIRWSFENGGQSPRLYYRLACFIIDNEHDLVLQMEPLKYARIKVLIKRVADLSDSDESADESNTDKALPPPNPSVCAKVRHFLESTLCSLREMWIRRLSYTARVICYCGKQCHYHGNAYCELLECLHFLNLDECLTNKIVCCEHRRIKTANYRKWFPSHHPVARPGPILPADILPSKDENVITNIEAKKGAELPGWVKSAAKLLNGGSEGQDWTELAKKLGYKKIRIDRFNDDLNPGLALIADWIISSGNTALSIDMMITYLEQMHRDDIIDIIHKGREYEVDPPQIFISYQWDKQDEVRQLRDWLERAGFTCWMDIGQMGGGDQLHQKIDLGIRNCKVVLACLSPKYIVSHICNRELSLADILRKPVVPIVYDKVPWPPPGGMALMFSQLIYIDMNGVGGHGGSGIHADLEDRYNEVIQQISHHTSPENPPQIDVEVSPAVDETDEKELTPRSDATVLSSDAISQDQSAAENVIQPDYNILNNTSVLPEHLHGDRVTPPNLQQQPTQQTLNSTVEQVSVTKCAICTIL
ncbi:uncharacterized protein LOC141900379 [Tubulanus polymorphus]|uniref:uncharacterized protein LOC141900379 n=1 Tax=Tubulanus polymorphus TaxID=672921 RepID=UPI003DA46E03